MPYELVCSVIADAVEAVIGAIFIDSGECFPRVRQVVLSWFRSRLDTIAPNVNQKDNKSTLQEYLQMEYGLDAEDALAAIQTVQESAKQSKGVAEEMAETMQDNLAGMITELQSKLSELALSLAETLLPIVKSVTEYIKKLTDWFNNLSPATKELIVKIGLIAAVVGPALLIVGKIVTAIGSIVGGIGKLIGIISTVGPALTGVLPAIGGLAAAAAPFLIGGAVIAGIVAGVALIIKHWDDIKAAAGKFKDDMSENWQFMKESISETASSIKETISGKWEEIKQGTAEKWNAIKSSLDENWQFMKALAETGASLIGQIVSDKWEETKHKTSEAWSNIKSDVADSWNNMKDSAVNKGAEIFSTVSDKFFAIYDKISEKMHAARDKVSEIIERIKGLFDFHWSLPDLKLPHIVVGDYIDVPVIGTIPNPSTLHVEWYKKAMNDPRILKGASIFGYNNGKLLAGGEAGEEVVSGKETLLDLIRQAVASVQSVQIGNYSAAMREALQSASFQVSYGDVHMNVYGAEGQDVRQLADEISLRLKGDYEREKAVWK